MHTNSGIHNKVAYLLIQGGSFNGYDVQAIGAVRARRLFYYVLTNWLTPNATLREARDAAIGEALIQQRRGELSPANVCSVRRAYAAVGIGFPDLNCDGIDDNRQPDPDEDGVENGADNCPTVWNPGQDDIDNDKVGDLCDPDRDGDGGSIATTTARRTYNPGQADWNRDKEGDACDDTDGDFVNDDKDNCRLDRNPRAGKPGRRSRWAMSATQTGTATAGQTRATTARCTTIPARRTPQKLPLGLPADGLGTAAISVPWSPALTMRTWTRNKINWPTRAMTTTTATG